MIGSDDFQSFWGFTGSNHHDMLVNIVSRAIKVGGYSVVLLQPDSWQGACFATDTAIKRGHLCQGLNQAAHLPYDVLEPQEDPRKTRTIVSAAIARATARYGGGSLNIAIPVATLAQPARTNLGVVGGLLIVPPSVVNGEVVRLVSEH